jgi:hypothetical protein
MLVPSSGFLGPFSGNQPRFPLIVDGGAVRLTQKPKPMVERLEGSGQEVNIASDEVDWFRSRCMAA